MVIEAADAGTDEVRTALAAYTLAAECREADRHFGDRPGPDRQRRSPTSSPAAPATTCWTAAAGADQLAGGLGNDLYLVEAGDTVIEAAGDGTDEVRTALAAYTLGADLERLTGTSADGPER